MTPRLSTVNRALAAASRSEGHMRAVYAAVARIELAQLRDATDCAARSLDALEADIVRTLPPTVAQPGRSAA